MKNLVGMWYSNQEPLWWLSFAEPDEERPWWKFWRRAKGGQFLGVVIVQAPDMDDAVQVAWRKKINPGGEVCGILILNADLDDLDRLIPYEEASEIAKRTKVLDVKKLCAARDAGERRIYRRPPMREGKRQTHNAQLLV